LVSLVKPVLDAVRLVSPREFNAAKQFVGWAVGRIMRNHGHKIVGRSRVQRINHRGQYLERGPIRA
jgi:hypothetical protein